MRTATILAVSTTLLLGLVQDLAMGQELPDKCRPVLEFGRTTQ